MIGKSHKMAWLAGLLDGEGYFSFQKTRHGKYGRAQIVVRMIDKPTIMAAHRVGRVGFVYQHNRTSSGHKVWAWVVSKTDDLLALIAMLLPHLVTKRMHAQAMVLYLLTRSDRDKRRIAERIKSTYTKGRASS